MTRNAIENVIRCAVLLGAFAWAPVALAQYASTKELIVEQKAARDAKERAFLSELVGKTYWTVPTSGSKTYPFYKQLRTPELQFNGEFVPTVPTSFEVIELIVGKNYKGYSDYAYRVRFEDGVEGFIKAFAMGGDSWTWRDVRLSNQLTDLEYSGNDKFFTESPEAIRATAARAAAEKREVLRQKALEIEAQEAKQQKALAAAQADAKRRGGVRVGMSAKQVRASNWGLPDSVNRTTTAYGVDEQWIYDSGSYLYFRNGRLTAIQN